MERTFPADEAGEYQRRHDAVVSAMRARGLEQLVLTSMESLYYLTGATAEPLERPFFLIVDAARGQRRLLVPLLEQGHLRKAWGPPGAQEVDAYAEYPAPPGQGWAEALERILRRGTSDAAGGGFAFEPSTPLSRGELLLELGGRPIDLLEPIRIVKSEYEIRKIERAARYAVWGVEELLRSAYEGATVIEGYMTGTSLRRKIIQEEESFDALATNVIAAPWPAPISAEPHSVPGARMTLGPGPHVALVLTRVNGYAAECERTFFTTPPTAEQRQLFETMLQARKVAFEKIRPGVPAAALDEAVDAFLDREGFSDRQKRLHRTGHGFGLGNHEPPWIARGSTHVLAENMLLSVEPGLYLEGQGGYRHSDTVLVTRDGYRVLTPAPTDLESLTFGRPSLKQRARAAVVRRLAGIA